MLHRFIASIVGLAVVTVIAPASAQDYPTKPIKIIVPFAAGGPADIYARFIGARLTDTLGQPVVVEDRPGGGSIIGTDAVAKSAPDGYTLLMMSNTHTVNETLIPNRPFALMRDFVPITPINYSDLLLVVHPSTGITSVAELIKQAKANPGKLNYASAGNGSATHLAMAYFAGMAGVEITHIPYKATGEAINEVIADRAQAVIAANIGALQFKDDKRVRLVGVTSKARSKFVPALPTLAESGLPNYEFTSWFGLLAPAGTPKATTDAINAAIDKLLKDPAVQERLARQGIEYGAMTNADFAKLLAAEAERTKEIVRLAGVKPE